MSGTRMDLTIPTVSVRAMVDQLPNRGREAEMLQEMGLTSMEDLFADIPDDVRFKGELPLPGPQSERRSSAMRDACSVPTLTWAADPPSWVLDCTENHVPAAVFQLVYTRRVPHGLHAYQPKSGVGACSKPCGSSQTLISELVGLPIANLSLYDGSTAAAAGLDMCRCVHNRKASQPNTVYVSALTPPDKLSVMHNYCQGAEIEIRTIAHNEDGTLNMDSLKEAAGSCGVYLEQQPAGCARRRTDCGEGHHR